MFVTIRPHSFFNAPVKVNDEHAFQPYNDGTYTWCVFGYWHTLGYAKIVDNECDVFVGDPNIECHSNCGSLKNQLRWAKTVFSSDTKRPHHSNEKFKFFCFPKKKKMKIFVSYTVKIKKNIKLEILTCIPYQCNIFPTIERCSS